MTDPQKLRPDYLPFGKPAFTDEEIDAVTRVLRSGWVGMGPETIAFEKELAAYLGVPHVVTVNSCTSALFLALLVAGVQPGDEVICPSLTWCSTANAALYLGATPVFCDVDPATLCATPATIRAKLTAKTKAVMVVHFGGLAAEVDAIRAVLPRHVALVEDAAHALGSTFPDGRRVGASGHLTCFSFYANKNLSTAEGGAIALTDGDLAGRLQSLRLHALPVDAWKRFSQPHSLLINSVTELGYKMNYTDLQAALGRVQLRRQPELAIRRRLIAQQYHDRLGHLSPPIQVQADILADHHSRHLYVVRSNWAGGRLTRNDLVTALRSRNIGASIHYGALHLMPLYARPDAGPLPCAESVCQSVLTLPISASMETTDATYVCQHLCDLLQ
jgi:dTDP-4-amino-4,6-dideoxygalactose transaminase